MSEENHFSSKSSAFTIHASLLMEVYKQKEHSLVGATLTFPGEGDGSKCNLSFKGSVWLAAPSSSLLGGCAGPISLKSREEHRPTLVLFDHHT